MADQLLHTRAMFEPSTINVEERTVEMVWTTGARVKRESWSRGNYTEELSLQPGAVRLDRLNAGAPLLNSHSSYDLRDQIGVVLRAWLTGAEGRALVKFSRRDDVEPFFQDVRDGIIRNVSVGYKVHRTERDETGDMPVERAVDWEPYELSLVPIPADAGSQVRSEEPTPTPTERSMAELNQGAPAAEPAPETTIETRAAAPAAPPAAPAPASVDVEQIRAEERRRAAGILDAARKLGVEDTIAHGLIERGVSLDQARAELIDARSTTERQSSAGTSRIEVGVEHGDKRREAMLHGLQARAGIQSWDEGGAREYRGTTLLDLGRECLERAGVNTRGLSKGEVATRAMHDTSDFPILLTSIQRVTMKAAYGEQRQTWQVLARRDDLPDFRPMTTIEIGEAGDGTSTGGALLPEELKAGGEYKSGTIKESKGTWNLSEYGKKVTVGRRYIINDNLGYITRTVQILGRKIAVFESNMMWALITGNAKTMMDGVALFHASHNNIGTGAISDTSLAEARQKMRDQKGFDGSELYIEPRYILLPSSLEYTFDKINATVIPNQTANVNIFSDYLTKIVEPRLSGSAQWYIAGDGAGVDKLLYGYLEGEGGPSIEQISSRDPDGVTTYIRHSFGCTVPQHQAFYRSSGV